MLGVKLLSAEERIKVAADLASLSTENLLVKAVSFSELPTCLELVNLELEKRGYRYCYLCRKHTETKDESCEVCRLSKTHPCGV